MVVDTKLAKDVPALRKALGEADGIVIRSGTQLTAEVLEGQSRLKAIVRAGVGVDNIDVAGGDPSRDRRDEHPRRQHRLDRRAHHGADARPARNVAQANDSLKSGKWDRNKFTGTQLEGKTLGSRRSGAGRAGGGQAGPGLRHDGGRL